MTTAARITARLRSARARRILAAAALLTCAAPAILLATGGAATAAPSLDVFAVKGSGTAVRVTVDTGYSFVAEPDANIPRAAATIEADQVNALASPLDPGDSVDALPGVGLPTAEQDIENGAATPNPLPSPVGGSTPPPQFTQTVDAVVSQFASIFNPTLTVPYEHAQATYPNPSGAAQRSVFPPPGPGNVPPQLPELQDFADPAGLMSAHSSVGSAQASAGSGIADAGEGSAISVPALGLRVGRVSSHVEVRGGSGSRDGAAVSTVVTTLQDVDLAAPAGVALPAPLGPGTALLHIGSLVLTATTTRAPGTQNATAQTDLEAAGVTVAGQSARLDDHGLTVLGSPSPLNGVAQTLIGTLSSPDCVPNTPAGVPGVGTVTSQPKLQIGMPQLQSQVTHGGNEASVTMTGPMLCIATTAPIPGTNLQVAATPTIYTITLGDLTSSAYGLSFPAETTAIAPLLPPMPETGVAGSPGSIVSSTTISGGDTGSANAAPPQQGGQHRAAARGLLAVLTGGILSPKVVVTVATLAELALLSTLWLSYRLAAAARRDDTSPTTRMDLV